ncbi:MULTISPECIES: hypothetical protein [Spirulina sp. CCY15215]|uniref:hypothetical protein n=1 Tax=Spirulina sp. CCY15215 TaxID=2767591 RepID=UPI00194EC3D5|nr:hypothetical protein [Spirulina major]
MKVKYLTTLATVSLLSLGLAVGCASPDATEGEKTEQADPCAGKTDGADPCAGKTDGADPCAGKTDGADPCAGKTE